MGKNDELDSLLRHDLMSDEDWQFLHAFTDGLDETAFSKRPARTINEYVRHGCYGHSIANLVREWYEPDYVEIVRATAAKFEIAGYQWREVRPLERAILDAVIEKLKDQFIQEHGQDGWAQAQHEAYEALLREASEGRIPKTDFDALKGAGPAATYALLAAGKMSGITVYLWANKIFFAISTRLGLGLGVATVGPIIGKSLSVLLGPAGWLFTTAWLVYDLGKTNWRKTIAIVTGVALLRLRIEEREGGADGS